MFDPVKPSIAIAYSLDSNGRLLLSWSDKWKSFTLPMTKVELEPPSESPTEAAVRAAAEVLHVPCRVVAGTSPQFFRGLQRSNRDAEIKDYQFNVVAIQPHPDFAPDAHGGVWVSLDKLRAGEYQPLSTTVEEVLTHCLEWGW